MDFYFPTKQIKQCSQCKGGGFVPLEDSTLISTRDVTVEIKCEKCKGRGKITKRVNLSLDSLKDLLK